MGFFFCKQKTAYEMRISDWSSDVCSSDLNPFGQVAVHLREDGVGRLVRIETAPFIASRAVPEFLGQGIASRSGLERSNNGLAQLLDSLRVMVEQLLGLQAPPHLLRGAGRLIASQPPQPLIRSEKHTSALQSLTRTSVAVY